MLERLVTAYPRYMTRSALGADVGLPNDGSTFQAYLSSLSGAGLIEKNGSEVRASPTLFPN